MQAPLATLLACFQLLEPVVAGLARLLGVREGFLELGVAR